VDRDSATVVATDIVSIELLENAPWVATGGRDGDAAILRMRPGGEWVVATSAEGMLNPPPAFDARGVRLRTIGVQLWALAGATSPSRLYRIEWRIRVDEVRGEGAELVRCAHDLAESADARLLFRTCDNRIVEARNDGATLQPVRAIPLPPQTVDPTSERIVVDGRTAFVALNAEHDGGAGAGSRASIVRVDDAGAATLFDEPDAIITSMAVTPRAVLAVLKRSDGSTEAVRLTRSGAAPSS
jgi:hypothetical protein